MRFVEVAARNPPSVPSFSYSPTVGGNIGQTTSFAVTLNASLFESLGSRNDNIHCFVLRTLFELVGHRDAVEEVTTQYFNTVNSWFTIIEKATLDIRVEEMWNCPSAETAMLLLAMMLILRTPSDCANNMDDGVYLSVKTTSTLVQNKVPGSMILLQAQLLIAMYELAHGLPQQAYTTVGSCVQMTRAFGWHIRSFWSDERRQLLAAELKHSAILWWALIYVDR